MAASSAGGGGGINETLVDKTYDALLTIVHTTAISKRVLVRPPFTFLHKLLVETLSEYGIFSAKQLVFAELVTKEDKAAFLTRAIAFVTFTMHRAKYKQISCLFLVSPIKVLAGVGVEETHEFLQQLCVVCRSNNREAKELAAQEVLTKGDVRLYSSGVTFRKGLLLIQAIIRTFIRRRVKERRAAMGITEGSNGPAKSPWTRAETKLSNAPMIMEVGTRFQKELSNGLIYDGTIVAIENKRYQLQYAQNPRSKEEVDEIEMRILLEESYRLLQRRGHLLDSNQRAPDQIHSRSDTEELLLTGLPDLTPLKEEEVSQPRGNPFRRLSSRGSERRSSTSSIGSSVTGSPFESGSPGGARQAVFRRSSSSAQDSGRYFDHAAPENRNQRPSSSTSSRSSSSRRGRSEPGPTRLSTESITSVELKAAPAGLSDGDEQSKLVPDTKSPEQSDPVAGWQVSLKQLLDKAQADTEASAVAAPRKKIKQKQEPSPVVTSKSVRASMVNNNMVLMSHMPIFPELRIPGQKQLPPVTKRKQPTAGFSSKTQPSPLKSVGTKHPIESSPRSETSSQDKSTQPSRHISTNRLERISAISMSSDYVVDKAFGATTYQSTDPHKTEEKMALFREIVYRIDAYMKRKHLRVIDLFRFCDTDGNGSISPQEMMDTLAQLEIQLSIQQAHDFLHYIDKDGNGSIDIDEFEELVRVARRSQAQRAQGIKDLHHARKQERKTGKNKLVSLIKHRQRILDDIQAVGVNDNGTVYGSQVRSVILRLQNTGVDDMVIHEFLERTKATAVSMGWMSSHSDPTLDPIFHLDHIASTLHDLELSTKANGFLDQSWLAQFDSQLERAYRDFELL